jgi:ribonuclease HI
VFMDSELVIRSVHNEVTFKSEELKRLRTEARDLYRTFGDRRLTWVPREMNTEADLLASAALPLRPTRG